MLLTLKLGACAIFLLSCDDIYVSGIIKLKIKKVNKNPTNKTELIFSFINSPHI